jgi:hypothetical protein
MHSPVYYPLPLPPPSFALSIPFYPLKLLPIPPPVYHDSAVPTIELVAYITMPSAPGPPPRHQLISISSFLYQLHRDNTKLSASLEDLRELTSTLEREKAQLLQKKMLQIEQEKEQFMQRSTFILEPPTELATPRKPRLVEQQLFKLPDVEASAAAETQRKRTIMRSPEAPIFGFVIPPPVPKLPDLSGFPGFPFLQPPPGLPARPATAPLPRLSAPPGFPDIPGSPVFADLPPMPETPRVRHQSIDKIRKLRFTEDTKPAADYGKPKMRRSTHGDGKRVIMEEFDVNAEIEEMMVDIQKWCEEADCDEAEFEGVGVAI